MTKSSRDQQPVTQWYVVCPATADRQVVEQCCLAVLEVVRPRAERVWIDAYSDHRANLPALAQQAQDELRSRGSLRTGRHRGDPGMAVELDPSRPADWELVRTYGPFSIHVELAGLEDDLATLDDSGLSISVNLTEAEAGRLAGMLPEPLNLKVRGLR